MNLGQVFIGKNEFEKAEEYFEKALLPDSTNADIFVGLGVIEGRRKNYTEAKEYFERAIELKPDSQEAHYNLGLVFKNMGDKEGARRELEIFNKLKQQKTPL